MDTVEMVVLITDTPADAHGTLGELKRLERAGWIGLTSYAVVDKDETGAIRVQEASDPVEPVSMASAEGAGGPGAGHTRLDATIETLQNGLQPGNSALMVVLDKRYAERVVEEMETRGRTLRKQLERGEREAALRASVERVKTNVSWLADLLRGELAKAGRAEGREKEAFEATIAATRAELDSERENLHARLKALAAELDGDLHEMRQKLQESDDPDDPDRTVLARRIDGIENAISDCNQDLALSILDHMDSLAAHAFDLQAKAARASAEAAKAIEAQLYELEIRMRKHRAELTATLGLSAARQCMDRLRVEEAALGKAELKEALHEHLEKLEERHAMLKVDLRRLEKEDTRVWHERAAGFRKSWSALSESVQHAKRECH